MPLALSLPRTCAVYEPGSSSSPTTCSKILILSLRPKTVAELFCLSRSGLTLPALLYSYLIFLMPRSETPLKNQRRTPVSCSMANRIFTVESLIEISLMAQSKVQIHCSCDQSTGGNCGSRSTRSLGSISTRTPAKGPYRDSAELLVAMTSAFWTSIDRRALRVGLIHVGFAEHEMLIPVRTHTTIENTQSFDGMLILSDSQICMAQALGVLATLPPEESSLMRP